MPLNKNLGIVDGRYLPYEIKLAIFEENCSKCPYAYVRHAEGDIPLSELSTLGKSYFVERGCVYPRDIDGINPNIREPYLTLTEICANGCEFWKASPQLTPVDEPQPNIVDFMAFPKHIRSKIKLARRVVGSHKETEIHSLGKKEIPIEINYAETEDYPLTDFAEHCGEMY